MSNARTADWAATVPVSGVIGLNLGQDATKDISKITAKGWRNKSIPQVVNGKFIPQDPNNIIDTTKFYSVDNPPWLTTTFSWSPGTITPFGRTTLTVNVPGVEEGDAVMIGAPYALQGCRFDWSVGSASVEIELFNSTPYDVTLDTGIWQILSAK